MQSAVGSSELVRGLQERAARALPAEHVEDAGGWWLRHAPGRSWWAGTVLPHHDARADDLVRRIARAEEFYSGHGRATTFQISPGVGPEQLDSVLAERGYHRHTPMSLQVATVDHVRRQAPSTPLRVQLDSHPARQWFTIWATANGYDGDYRSEWDMLARVSQPSAYAYAMLADDIVAVGRAVADTGWAGVYGMATLPEARGKGAARSVLAALATWADTQQAKNLYLQVERDNPTGLHLYERTGFTELCAYHYRTAEPTK